MGFRENIHMGRKTRGAKRVVRLPMLRADARGNRDLIGGGRCSSF